MTLLLLSACLPVITPAENGLNLEVEVQNFGQVASKTADLKVLYIKDNKEAEVAAGKIPALKPNEKSIVKLKCGNLFDKGVEYNLVVIIGTDDKNPVRLHGKITYFA